MPKTLPPKLTPRQFVRACQVFGDNTPGEVASMFHKRALPKWSAVAEASEMMADEIKPDFSTIPAHTKLINIAEWAKAQAKA